MRIRFTSADRPVDERTQFQIASLSKWVTAWGILALVEAGKVDLDAPVSAYMRRWRLPPSQFDLNAVSIRRLLSHTGGLVDGLGYQGFAESERVQTLEESLTHAADAMPGANGRAIVGVRPGSAWRYSGASYALLQMVIEDVTGEQFETYMQRTVLRPLGMLRSSFAAPHPEASVAQSFDTTGSTASFRKFSAPAAASLFSSAADLSLFVRAHLPAQDDHAAGRGVLRPSSIKLMQTPHAWRFSVPVYGLGNVLFLTTKAGSHIIGHDGENAPAVQTTVRFDSETGDGIVILATGTPGLVKDIASAWVYWKTGYVDIVAMSEKVHAASLLFIGGSVVIVLIVGSATWRALERDQSSSFP